MGDGEISEVEATAAPPGTMLKASEATIVAIETSFLVLLIRITPPQKIKEKSLSIFLSQESRFGLFSPIKPRIAPKILVLNLKNA